VSHIRIRHESKQIAVVVGTSPSGSTPFRMEGAAGGMVHVENVTATHTLTLYGSGDGVTFSPLYGHDGQAASVSVTATHGAYSLPDAVYPLRLVKLTSGTELGTAATVVLSLKS
jgi:hypothetical protein